MSGLVVVQAGALTTVQDLGRPGWAHVGVPRSGALDVPALRAANRLVGNPDGAAALETTLTGCAVSCTSSTTVAVTGAPAEVTVDGAAAAWGETVDVPAGALVTVGSAAAGVRSYLALAGGVAVRPLLGSRSTDTLSGLGPPPLTAGAHLPLGPPPPPPPHPPHPPHPSPSSIMRKWSPAEPVTVRVVPGPRDDWLTVAARVTLAGTTWTVSQRSNRVGVRLVGPTLERAVTAELPSEGVVLGSVQVPTDGQPLVFLADHPTTGGYPVVGVVVPADLPLLAQARPGSSLRFARTGD
ncbi:MAG: biotin-dependent carboxyltransferase family protein [Actinomycetes bacterium]